MVESLLSIPTPTPQALPIDRPTPPERDPVLARATSDGLERARITDVSDFRRERFIFDELGRVDRFSQVDQFAPPPNGVARDFFARPLVAEFVPGPRDFPANDIIERPFDRRTLPPTARDPQELAGSVIDTAFFDRLPGVGGGDFGPSPARLPESLASDFSDLAAADPRSQLGSLQEGRSTIIANLEVGQVADTVIRFDRPAQQSVFNELRAGIFDAFVDFEALANRDPGVVQPQSGAVPVAANIVANPADAVDNTLRTDIREFNVDNLNNVRNNDPRREVEFAEQAFARADEVPGAIRREPIVPASEDLDRVSRPDIDVAARREELRDPILNVTQAERALETDRGVVPGSIPLIEADFGRVTTSGAN